MLVSPNYQDTDFSWPLTLDDKIIIFLDRTEGWQLDIADQCINGRRDKMGIIITRPIAHSGFAVLNIVLSYFEMIAKYLAGYSKNSKSEYYFKQGLYAVFPQLKSEPPKIADGLLNVLYFGCRCGLYHGGMTDPSIVLSEEINFSLVFDPDQLKLKINPNLLVQSLKKHLKDYGHLIGDVHNNDLRQNFEKRFDYEALNLLRPAQGSSRKAKISRSSKKPKPAEKSVNILIKPNLKIIFFYINDPHSRRAGTYCSDSGNRFWTVLSRVGLTPKVLAPNQSHLLPNHGIGLLAMPPSGGGPGEYLSEAARAELLAKVESHAPIALAFNGKRAAQQLYSYALKYGQQPEPLGYWPAFVLPSTSGIAMKYWNEWYWREMADYVNSKPVHPKYQQPQ